MRTTFLRIVAVFIAFLCIGTNAVASHMEGGYMSYKLVSSTSTTKTYDVTLHLYADCMVGSPDAIDQDNPAFFGVYENNPGSSYPPVLTDTAVYFDSSGVIPLSALNPCLVGSLYTCILERQFTARFTLSNDRYGYVISWARCCWAGNISNIVAPANAGQTIYCVIPPTTNNSVIFGNAPQKIACIHSPVTFNLGATDADHDSLSYEFANSVGGGSAGDVKPIGGPPPYSNTALQYPATYLQPLSSDTGVTIDPVTGDIAFTPNLIGAYLLDVNCKEWRHDSLINTNNISFEVIVTNCSGLTAGSAGDDTAIVAGTILQFGASGGTSYQWLNTLNMSDSTIANPWVIFPDTGTFFYPVKITGASGCTVVDTLVVTVIGTSEAKMPNAFTPNGDGRNDIFKWESVGNCQINSFRIFNHFGQMVYSGTEGWDGKYNGTTQEQGVYTWELQYINSDKKLITSHGNMTLIR